MHLTILESGSVNTETFISTHANTLLKMTAFVTGVSMWSGKMGNGGLKYPKGCCMSRIIKIM